MYNLTPKFNIYTLSSAHLFGVSTFNWAEVVSIETKALV